MEEQNPAVLLLTWIFRLIFFLILLVIMITIIAAGGIYLVVYMTGDTNTFIGVLGPFINQFDTLLDNFFNNVFPSVWAFVSPLAQVAIILFVLEWFFRRMGISFAASTQNAGVIIQFIFVATIALLSLLSVVNRGLLDKIWDSLDQVIVMLIIFAAVVYFLNRMGFGADIFQQVGSINVQATMALVIIGALAILSLVNVEGANVVKDIALVVVGFYFGSRRDQAAGG